MNGIEFLRRKEVEKKTTLSKNSIYNFMREGNFPKSIEIRPKVVVWIKSEVEEWMDARSDGTTPTEDPEVESEGETEGNEEEVPVDRAHVLEAAEVLLDYVHLQNQQRMAKR